MEPWGTLNNKYRDKAKYSILLIYNLLSYAKLPYEEFISFFHVSGLNYYIK